MSSQPLPDTIAETSAAADPRPSKPALVDRRARLAVAAMFVVNGAYFGTWAARIPAIQERLQLTVAELGLALLALAAGAVGVMPIIGRLAAQHGSRPGMVAGVVLMTVALPLAAVAPSFLALAAALALLGAASGVLDLSMNAHGLVVEQRYGRPILSAFHGVWSTGGLAGAAIGAAFAGSGVTPFVHFATVALVVGLLGMLATRGLLPREVDRAAEPAPLRLPPRPIAILGLLAFGGLLAEGSIGDWSAVFMTDSLGAPEETAALAFAAFSLTMTMGRFAGDRMVQRFGPVTVMRGGGLLATGGMAMAISAGNPIVAILGFGCAGIGLASVVPLVFRAGGSNPLVPSGVGISGVATVGYAGFLAGPPAVGFAAESFGLPAALWIVVAMASLLALFARYVAPPSPAPSTTAAASPEPDRTSAADLRAAR